jgi:hypothetical protein
VESKVEHQNRLGAITMKVTDIEIHAGDINQPYKVLKEITAKASKASLLSKSPTIEDAESWRRCCTSRC